MLDGAKLGRVLAKAEVVARIAPPRPPEGRQGVPATRRDTSATALQSRMNGLLARLGHQPITDPPDPLDRILARLDAWDEAKHPRHPAGTPEGGQFTSAGSVGGANDVPLHEEELTQVGGQKGSNKGGVYKDKEGQEYYVKYVDPAHAQNEILASRLYALTGTNAVQLKPLTSGQGVEGVASKWKGGLKKTQKSETTDKDFIVHAWLANWDAVGLDEDNQMVTPEGHTMTIDVGGSLLYRAQGGPKGSAFGNKVPELETMRDPAVAPQAAKWFGHLTPQQIGESAHRVLGIPDDEIRELVQKYGPGSQLEKEKLAATLIARKNYIGQWLQDHGGLPASKKEEAEPEVKLEIPKPGAIGGVADTMYDYATAGHTTTEAKIEQIKEEMTYAAVGSASYQYGNKLLKALGAEPEGTPEPNDGPKWNPPEAGEEPLYGGFTVNAIANGDGTKENKIKELTELLSGGGLSQSGAILAQQAIKQLKGEEKTTSSSKAPETAKAFLDKIPEAPKYWPGATAKMAHALQDGLNGVTTIDDTVKAIKDIAATQKHSGPASYANKLLYLYGEALGLSKAETIAKFGGKASPKGEEGAAPSTPSDAAPAGGAKAAPAEPASKIASTTTTSKPVAPAKKLTPRQQRGYELEAKAKKFSTATGAEAKKACPTVDNLDWWHNTSNVSHAARSAMNHYTGSGYQEINKALRTGDGDEETVDAANAIYDLYEHEAASMTEDAILWRGEHVKESTLNEWRKALEKGLPCAYMKTGFVSTSMASRPAGIGAKHPTWFKIIAKKGTKALGLEGSGLAIDGENEVLLRHGQSFEVYDIQDDATLGKTIISMIVHS